MGKRKVNALVKLAVAKARPVNGDALRVCSLKTKSKPAPAPSEGQGRALEREPRRQPALAAPRKRVRKADGRLIEITPSTTDTESGARRPRAPTRR